jgi:hypothetical protein
MSHSPNNWWKALAGCVAIGIVIDIAYAEICKWVDENGTVHYAESCPEDVGSVEIEIQPPLPQAQVT